MVSTTVKQPVQVRRLRIGAAVDEIIHERAGLLNMRWPIVTLTGPRYGHIATGRVQEVQFGFGDWHVHLEVLVQGSSERTYTEEDWYVTFLPTKEKA